MQGSFLFLIPLYTVVFENISNMTTVLPKSEGNDISKFRNVQLMYNEKINMKPTKMDIFIRLYYSLVLVVFMAVLAVCPDIVENVFLYFLSILSGIVHLWKRKYL